MHKNYFKYLNITSFEQRWGNYVTALGYSKVNPKDRYPNQQHPESHDLTWNRGRILNDYYIVYISRGKGIYSSALTEPAEVVAGNCFFLFPGVRHRYKPDPKFGWEEFWVGFNGIQIQHLMNEGIFKNSNPILDLGYDGDILTLFNKLIEIVKASLAGYPQQISGITLQILGLINTKVKYSILTNNPDEKLMAKAKYIMQESFENDISMEEIAKELPLGYSSFRKKFKQLTGLSPNQYLLNLRLERAKYLLVMTNLNVGEIGNQIGFDNIFYFSNLFKKKYGISPKKYRLMNIEELK